MRRVVVTGLGVVTPLGIDLETVWSRMLEGRAGVASPRRVSDGRPPTRAVGEVPEEDVARLRVEYGDGEATTDLRTIFGVAAARRAMADAGLQAGRHPR